MPWDRRQREADPELKSGAYVRNRTLLKRRAQADRAPCARCGREIDYDSPTFARVDGVRVLNPAGFVAGHIIGRAEARELGIPASEIHALTNLQPECGACSASSGARTGHARRFGPGPRQPYSDPRW